MTPKDLSMCSLLDTYGDVLTEKQRNVMQMYYFEDFSLSEIAELEGGISRQGVRDFIKRGEVVLTELEDKLHFAGRFDSLREISDRIRKDAKVVLAYTDNGGYAGQIRRAAGDIVDACKLLDGLTEEEENGV
jgi:predicted DNA-binding protein YlxM (UPF0122 family)